jgi:flagellar hook assembly protein FlgD
MIDLAATARNPSSSFAFSFTLPEAQRTQASVVDLAGRRVARLVDGPLAAGRHEVRWDGLGAEGRPAPAGVYFFIVRAGDTRASRPVVKLD